MNLAFLFGLLASVLSSTPARPAPTTGREVLQTMHDAYAGKWYRTLRFVQKTTQHRPDGATVIATWYESLRYTAEHGSQLRIDIGAPSRGNGRLYTADSTWVMQGGHLTATQPEGNLFLPLIESVYLQPVERTLAELASSKVDMSRVVAGSWQDRPVWIIGVSDSSDRSTPQIWIDQERNVVVRVLLQRAASVGPLDITLGDYVAVGGGWLATQIRMLADGKPLQTEEYADWRVDVDLADALFSPSDWTTAPHWAAR
jgi:hypothetical protein